MLVTTSRQPITMGPLASPASQASPNGHHRPHHHLSSSPSDDEDNHSSHHLPADLSPRSTNSSSLSGESFGNNYPASPEHSKTEKSKMSPKFSPFYSGGDSEQQLDLSKQFAILGSPQAPSGGDLSDHDLDTFIRPSSINMEEHQAVIFQCPLCTLVCSSRHDFNEHLVTHSTEHRTCPRCSFVASNEDELRDHVAAEHSDEDMELLSDDDDVKNPKTNAQGKLKTFKCKQCEYTAVTKKEFWDHNKTHIRSEKMLHCPKCPFVTEYKHHLEYHLRNHMGSKPYQCTKCNYSCVNKSMLNSHLKSHSNVYQYRCQDCTYATKYCHSLKLHLRKYQHQPAMVLNPDGTPNPLPIIDVYGTRRGPKMKRPDPILEGLATTQPLHAQQQSQTKTPKGRKSSKKEKKTRENRAQPSPHYFQTATPPLKREDHSSGDSDSDMRSRQHPHHTLPQAPISPTSIAMILQQRNESRKDYRATSSPNPLEVYNAAISQYLMNPMFHMQNSGASLNDILAAATEQKTKLLASILQNVPGLASSDILRASPSFPALANGRGGGAGVLDLSSGTGSSTTSEEGRKQHRKRKGKAIRYEPPTSSTDDEKEEEALDFSNNNNSADYLNKNHKRGREISNANAAATDLRTSPSPQPQILMCKYCQISFPVKELYTIHMNYHSGDSDPFSCRSCGKQTRNNVEFFKHLATDPH